MKYHVTDDPTLCRYEGKHTIVEADSPEGAAKVALLEWVKDYHWSYRAPDTVRVVVAPWEPVVLDVEAALNIQIRPAKLEEER